MSDLARSAAERLGNAALPAVDRLLRSGATSTLLEDYGRDLVVEGMRAVLDRLRRELRAGRRPDAGEAAIVAQVRSWLDDVATPSLRPVYNLTGTVLHTNLGRAPLPEEAVDAMRRVASSAVNLEYGIASGKRGDRDDHVEPWICRLTGAEAATVVNNNAAAVLLVLNTLARRKEVLISRGELIEIGGAFRMPDVMARAGCKLREVGTTNRTHIRDFADAISPQVGLIMKAHTSNYRIEGFVAEAAEEDLAALGAAQGIPFVVDLGSGSIVDLSAFGLPKEPTLRETIAHGADLVTFSGDKLLGGPQAGIIAGRRRLIEKVKRNPMKRALRLDKVTIAALAAVLRLYGNPSKLVQRFPALRLLTRAGEDIQALAARLRPRLAEILADHAEVDVVECRSQIGSGALPVDLLPSAGLRIIPRGGKRRRGVAVARLAAAFRALPVPVIGRIEAGALVLDLRCLEDGEGFVDQLRHLRLDRTAASP